MKRKLRGSGGSLKKFGAFLLGSIATGAVSVGLSNVAPPKLIYPKDLAFCIGGIYLLWNGKRLSKGDSVKKWLIYGAGWNALLAPASTAASKKIAQQLRNET